MVKIFLVLFKILLVSTMTIAALDCDEDWVEFDSSCYKVMNTSGYSSELSWVKALRWCLGFGGNLISIANNMEMKFVNSLSLQLKNDGAWIGLFYWSQKGEYLWSDGTPFNNSVDINWLSDIQSNPSGFPHCVELLRYGWSLTNCYQENQHYICKKPKGLPSCPADWFQNGLSCYKHNKEEAATWNKAQQNCIASGGYLVQIDGDVEQQFMDYYMDITGLKKVAKHIWIGQKNDTKCAQMDAYKFGARDEESCDKHNYYVCEKPVSWPGNSCYQCQSNTSSANITVTVNCTFPENLCFKDSHRTGKNEKVIVQGCMSAEQCGRIGKENKYLECCEGHLCNKDVGPRCYECANTVSPEECPVRQCIFNDGQCFSAWTWKQQGSSVEKSFKYAGCTKQHDCGKTVNKYFIQCCHGSLCNKVHKFKELPRNSNSITMIGVSCGVAFILLLLLSIIGFRCYKKLHHRQLERSARSRRENTYEGWRFCDTSGRETEHKMRDRDNAVVNC